MADEKNIGTTAEEEIEIITLTDENGEDMDFEFLDLVEYEGKRYAVLLPPVEDVEGVSSGSGHALFATSPQYFS